MSAPPPGTRMHRLLCRWLPAAVRQDVLEPALADLQYEAERSHTPRERRRIIFRGYFAIVRAIVVSLEPGRAASPTLALAALSAMGMLLLSAARVAHVDGSVLNSAILAPAMLAPFILRLLGKRSVWGLFGGGLAVPALTVVVAGDLRQAVVVLIVFPPIAAAAAIVAAPYVDDGGPRRAIRAVSLGSAIATAALLFSRWPQSGAMSSAVMKTPFYLALFAVLFALTLLPLLLLTRSLTTRRALLAIAGLAFSPAPLIASAYIDHGTLTTCVEALRRTPLAFIVQSLPFVVGAIAVGWRLPPVSNSSPQGS